MIVATCYAVNPLKGSEDGTGWGLTQEVGRSYPLTVYTRLNNVSLANNHNLNNKIIYKGFDLPYIFRFWKKGKKGALMYFYFWQLGVAIKIAKESWKYELAWNVNFHNDWTPTFLWITGIKYIWGPVGHHPDIPKEFQFDDTCRVIELFKRIIKKYFWKYSLMHFIARKRASHILVINSEAAKIMKSSGALISTEASVGSYRNRKIEVQNSSDILRLLFVGRFVSLKGATILIDTMSNLDVNVQLIMIGQGPLENLIIEKIRTYNLQSRVVIVPWMQHEDVLKEYAKADLFFFPSFEGAGMVVVEALSNGLPVVCFDNSGPGEIVGDSDLKIPLIGSYNQVVKNFSNLIITYFYKSEEEKNEYSRNAQKRYELMYDWKVKGDRIVNIIRDVL